MPYTAEISRASPACFLFLVVQCMGMHDPMPGHPGQTKGNVAQDAVNRIVNTLSQRCSSGMEVRDYFHIGILSFNGGWVFVTSVNVDSALAGTTPERPFLPISQVVEVAEIEERKVKENYGGGEIVEVTRRMPVWLRVRGKGWMDPLQGMLNFVERPLAEWIDQHPDSYPPIVIIISDGVAVDDDPQEAAQRIRNLRTNDGNVLLFTIHLSSAEVSPTLFPGRPDGLPSLGEAPGDSKMMFDMASVLPESLRRQAADLGFAVDGDSRGLVLNADAVSLAQFLDIGTRGPSNLH